jgi:hypothetical protein
MGLVAFASSVSAGMSPFTFHFYSVPLITFMRSPFYRQMYEALQGAKHLCFLQQLLLSNLLGNHLDGHAQHPSFAFFHYEIEGQDSIAVTAIALCDAVEVVSASYHRHAHTTLRTSSHNVMLVNTIVANYLHYLHLLRHIITATSGDILQRNVYWRKKTTASHL